MDSSSLLNQPEQTTKNSKSSSKTTTPKTERAPRKKPAKSEKPIKFECEFCKKSFARESTLAVHLCTNKQRWLSRDDKNVKVGFIVYKKFYDLNYRNAKQRTYDDFMKSSHYAAFVKFGKYLMDINAINPESFIEFLLKAQVPLKNWELPFVYEQYIRELNKREPADSAFERNVLLMEQWARECDAEWTDFFKMVNPNIATKWIIGGRVSPWVLYAASTSQELFARLSDEQMKMIEQSVDPRFWSRKFEQQPDDFKFIRELLKEAGV